MKSKCGAGGVRAGEGAVGEQVGGEMGGEGEEMERDR